MECTKVISVWGLLLFASLSCTSCKPGGSVLLILRELEDLADSYNDYQFTIWVTCDGKTSDSGCLYGVGRTGVFHNTSNITFAEELGNGTRNPLKYNFTSFQGNLGISIVTRDGTGSKIHTYKYHQPVYPKYYNKKSWTNATLFPIDGTSSSNVKLTYQVHCNEHYYTPSCTVGCPPGANYKCDEGSGRKICINGFLGPNCTCKPHGHQYNCDATGKRICYPPWHGEKCDVECRAKNDRFGGYTCNLNTGAKLCLTGWYGRECNETTPVVKTSSSTSQSYIETPRGRNTVPKQTNSNFIWTRTSNSYHETFISLDSQMMTLTHGITPSFVTSLLMASLPTTSQISMTSSKAMTTTTKTSSQINTHLFPSQINTHLFPSYFVSTLPIGPKTIRDHTRFLTENNYPHTIIITQSYLANHEFVFTENNFHRTMSIEITEVMNDQTETIRDRSEITRDQKEKQTEIPKDQIKLSKSVHQNIKPTLSTQLTRFQEKTDNFEHEDSDRVNPRIESKVINDHGDSTQNANTSHRTTFKPGSKDARKNQDIWWLILLPLVFAAILIVIGIAILRKRDRKRRKVTPHYQASMQQYNVKPHKNKTTNEKTDGHYQKNAQNILVSNSDEPSSQEDFEAIWKVMSTPHA